DENDGYFDHIPPFVAPNPKDRNAVSKGIDTREEYVTLQQERAKDDIDQEDARESPVGLGFRVPMLVASPRSEGGWVSAGDGDISSTLMFLEKFLGKQTGKNIEEPNIRTGRRTVCGDLTSSVRTFDRKETALPEFVERNTFMHEVYNASFME